MNASTPQGKAVRSRATHRLRDLTIGTTLAGLAASAGFGWLAAATFDGSSLKTANAADPSTTTLDSSIGSPSVVGGTTDAAGDQSASSTALPSTSSVSRSSRKAHVSTGGS